MANQHLDFITPFNVSSKISINTHLMVYIGQHVTCTVGL